MNWRLLDHFEQLVETVKRVVPFPEQDREMTVYKLYPILQCQLSDFPIGVSSSIDGGSYLMLPSLGHEATGLGPECGSTPPEDSKLWLSSEGGPIIWRCQAVVAPGKARKVRQSDPTIPISGVSCCS